MNALNRRAYRSGGWHEMSAPQQRALKRQCSAVLRGPYCVRMSMMPRYARPNGVSSARSWNRVRVSSAANVANGPSAPPSCASPPSLRDPRRPSDGGAPSARALNARAPPLVSPPESGRAPAEPTSAIGEGGGETSIPGTGTASEGPPGAPRWSPPVPAFGSPSSA